MPSQRAFGRVVEVRLLSTEGSPIFFNGFDVDFKVEADVKESTPNKCDVTLFNLPADYRAAFQKSGCQLLLTAGYKNSNVALIGTYDVQRASSQLEGPDWLTQVQCSEGMAAMRNALFSSTFPPGVRCATVYRQLSNALASLGVTPGNFAATMGAVPSSFPNGIALEGRVATLLDQYARKEGFFFSVQDGQQTYLTATGTSSKTIVLSPDTGLIGLPEFSEADPKMKKPVHIKCRSLLRPEARPGQAVSIDLPPGQGFVRGMLKATKVTHNGSTYAQSFYTDFECEVVS